MARGAGRKAQGAGRVVTRCDANITQESLTVNYEKVFDLHFAGAYDEFFLSDRNTKGKCSKWS